MSVRLILTATGSGDLREPIEEWLTSYCEQDAECAFTPTPDQILLEAHPAAEPVEFSFVERSRVVVTAATSAAGPGFHLFVCDLLHQLGEELALEWDEPNEESSLDDTGYFFSGDREAPARVMSEWLATLTAADLAVLPLGPREQADFAQFPWPGEERDARYHLNRALTLMWLQVRWRAPLDDEERAVDLAALGHLQMAYELDPALPYPAAEWHELAGYVESEAAPPVPAPAEAPAEPIGYLRRWLQVPVRGNWTVKIPGSMATQMEGETWTAYDHDTTVEITIFPFEKKTPEQILGEAFRRERDEALEAGPHERRATSEYVEEDECFALNGLIAIPERLCVVNVYFADEALRGQAMAIWESIEARTAEAAE